MLLYTYVICNYSGADPGIQLRGC